VIQYSLALVYYELLTGAFPFHGKSVAQLMMQHVTETPDLSGLPETDAPIVARALAKVPEQRFNGCAEFVETLARTARQDLPTMAVTVWPNEAEPAEPAGSGPERAPALSASAAKHRPKKARRRAVQRRRAKRPTLECCARVLAPALPVAAGVPAHPPLPVEPARRLPLVVPCAILSSASVTPAESLPTAGQFVVEALQAAGCIISLDPQPAARYLLRTGPALECTFPVRAIPRVLELEVEGFGQHWQAAIQRRDADGFVLRVHDSAPFWHRYVSRPRGLEIEVRLPGRQPRGNVLSEVVARITLFGRRPGASSDHLLARGPLLLESLRAFLHASDKRARSRLNFLQPIRIFRVLPSGEVAPGLLAEGKNISVDGLALFVDQLLHTDQVYLNLCRVPSVAAFALLARVVRVRPTGKGAFEIGTSFLVDDSWFRARMPAQSLSG
jgi:hypothetical protein